jgi:hypothetical protein
MEVFKLFRNKIVDSLRKVELKSQKLNGLKIARPKLRTILNLKIHVLKMLITI